MMQDIDFDELDRAVSSVAGAPVEEPTSEDDNVTVKTTAPAPTPSTPAARRSSGRFMDVVHPSSDMRPATPERSTPRPPEPRAEEPAERSSDWPDPLDFHGFTGNELDDEKKEESKQEEPVTPPEEPAKEELEAAAPLESPFLAGTKVEKRPLGAFSVDPPEAPAEPTPAPKEEKLLDAPDEELLDAKTEPEEAPKEEKPEEPAKEEPEEPASAPEPEEPVGPTSITQQYKETPAKDEESSPIYAAEATTLALTHAPKKRSSALIIIWIFALILVGVGAGLAVYFLVLPTLHT